MPNTNLNSIVEAKSKCQDLGFKSGTESFANCTLKLLEKDNDSSSKNTAREAREATERANYESARQRAAALQEECKEVKKSRAIDAMACSLNCLTYQLGSASQFACNDRCAELSSQIPKCE